MITRTATIGSSVGLHARPAAIFASAAADTGIDVGIALGDDEAVDAGSILEVMTLGAKHGDVVTLSSDDDTAGPVLDQLVTLLESDLDA